MSGTLWIRDDPKAVWVPSGWIYDAVLRRIAKELVHTAPKLAEMLDQAQSSSSGGHGDVRPLDASQFRVLFKATQHAFDYALMEGPATLAEPDAYFGFICIFSELNGLLRTDPRLGREENLLGEIVINESAEWTAANWIFIMVLEHLAAQVRSTDAAMAEFLMAARGTERCDLRRLPGAAFFGLLPAVEWMVARYGDGLGRSAVAPAFLGRLAPAVCHLRALVLGDRRAAET